MKTRLRPGFFIAPRHDATVQCCLLCNPMERSSESTRWPCLRAAAGGVLLAVSVVPGAKRTELVGLHDNALRIRLAAPPIEGRANEALIAWLAAELSLPRRAVTLERGTSARHKQLRVSATPDQVRAWLDARCPKR